MPWNGTTKLMTWPIAIGDAADALGWVSGDLSAIIENSSTINKWAKYKPVRNADKGWVLRNSFANLGFDPTAVQCRKASDFVNCYLGTQTGHDNGWVYLKPRGKKTSSSPSGQTADEWHRLLDLVRVNTGGVIDTSNPGYHQAAKNPFGTFRMQDGPYFSSGDLISGQCILPPVPASGGVAAYPEYDIAITDINNVITASSLKMYYFGIAMSSDDLAPTALVLFPTTIRIDTGDVGRGEEKLVCRDIPFSGFPAGQYRFYPFLTDSPITTEQSISGTAFSQNLERVLYPIPGAEPALRRVIDQLVAVRVSAVASNYTNGTMTVTYNMSVKNNGNGTITLRNMRVRLRYASSEEDNPAIYGDEKSYNITNPSTVTLGPAGSTSPSDTATIVSQVSVSQINTSLDVIYGHVECTGSGGYANSYNGKNYIIKPHDPEV